MLLSSGRHRQLHFIAGLYLCLQFTRIELAAAGVVARVCRKKQPLSGAHRCARFGLELGAITRRLQSLIVGLVCKMP